MNKRRYIVGLMIFLCTIFLLGITSEEVLAETEERKICKGIFIDSIDMEGMSVEEANKVIVEYIEKLKNKKLFIKVDGNIIETDLKDMGYECVENNYVEEALNMGKKGNLVKRYKEIKDVAHDQLVYKLEFVLDKDKVQKLVETKCSKYDIEAKDATIKRGSGEFITTAHTIGRVVQVEETVKKIESVISKDWDKKDIHIDAVTKDVMPKVTQEDMQKCKTVLGSYSTTYYNSSINRAINIKNAAGLINGAVVLPGEVYSTAAGMSPITLSNGYHIGIAYSLGEEIESVGGGVCQVSTTLYNAVLDAELEVVERANHSMIVGYVDPAKDAAIAGTWKDLKFKNNTDTPVYIQAYTEGEKITFVIYGEETRDTENREVKYVSETVKTIQPGKDIIKKDNTKPKSYREVTQKAHIGYKAYLWKIVYQNGVEVSKEQVNFSSYDAEPAHVTVGTKKEKISTPTSTPTVSPITNPRQHESKEPGKVEPDSTEE
jgi:vancomycin resistance protein YoaR